MWQNGISATALFDGMTRTIINYDKNLKKIFICLQITSARKLCQGDVASMLRWYRVSVKNYKKNYFLVNSDKLLKNLKVAALNFTQPPHCYQASSAVVNQSINQSSKHFQSGLSHTQQDGQNSCINIARQICQSLIPADLYVGL